MDEDNQATDTLETEAGRDEYLYPRDSIPPEDLNQAFVEFDEAGLVISTDAETYADLPPFSAVECDEGLDLTDLEAEIRCEIPDSGLSALVSREGSDQLTFRVSNRLIPVHLDDEGELILDHDEIAPDGPDVPEDDGMSEHDGMDEDDGMDEEDGEDSGM